MQPSRHPEPSSSARTTLTSTEAKLAWIDGYRFRLAELRPELAPLDATLLAVDAHSVHGTRGVCPLQAAECYAALRAGWVAEAAPEGSAIDLEARQRP
ncbi:hypothetical protein BH11PSE8_BH11PSE8_39500 [soil metagenome]